MKYFSWKKLLFVVNSKIKKINWKYSHLILQYIRTWIKSCNLRAIIVEQFNIFEILLPNNGTRTEFNFSATPLKKLCPKYHSTLSNKIMSLCSVRRSWWLVKMNFKTFLQTSVYLMAFFWCRISATGQVKIANVYLNMVPKPVPVFFVHGRLFQYAFVTAPMVSYAYSYAFNKSP